MTPNQVLEAEAEAKRFLGRIKQLRDAGGLSQTGDRRNWPILGLPKETGAVRRASMDLTRALAKMRK